MTTAKNRHLHEVDILCALGTVLAILGHSHPNDWSTFLGKWVEFIYTFHMPLFFCIAGFLLAASQSLRRQSYGEWIWKKALRLLTPYVVLSVITLIPKYMLEHGGLSGLDFRFLLTSFLMPREGVWGHFWFLSVLFLLYAVFGLLRKQIPVNGKIGGGQLRRRCSRFALPWTITTPAMFVAGLIFPCAVIWIYRQCRFLHCAFMDLLLGVRRENNG